MAILPVLGSSRPRSVALAFLALFCEWFFSVERIPGAGHYSPFGYGVERVTVFLGAGRNCSMGTILIDKLLQTVVNTGASDLHIAVGQPPVIRLHG